MLITRSFWRQMIGTSTTLSSERTIRTPIPATVNDVRAWYLNHLEQVPVPAVAASNLVPTVMVRHLLSSKCMSAIKVKFKPGDRITNMEGAMHTLVSMAALPVWMHGDNAFVDNHHTVFYYPPSKGSHVARCVALSALIQPDFEDRQVMYELCRLEHMEIVGTPLGNEWKILSAADKQDDKLRRSYDMGLKRHLIYYLTSQKHLPGTGDVGLSTKEKVVAAILYGDVRDLYYKPDDGVLSIELLANAVDKQIQVELANLDRLLPKGYIYTWDPPAIFAQTLSPDILDALWCRSLLAHASSSMSAVVFNDYRNRTIIPRLRDGMQDRAIAVYSRSELYPGRGRRLIIPSQASGADADGTVIVLHNNGDAFGRNIETETETMSLDGAIGSSSSAAASFHPLKCAEIESILRVE